MELYEVAAEGGDARARHSLAAFYFEGLVCPRDAPRAVALWRSAADAGIVNAMRQLAFVYLEGRGVAKNERLAFHYTARAAKLDDPGAKRNLAKMLHDGVGCDPDPVASMALVGRLAENWDGTCLDMTCSWFDRYVEASARMEAERLNRRDPGMYGADRPVPEWGDNPPMDGVDDDDDDEGFSVDKPWTPPTE